VDDISTPAYLKGTRGIPQDDGFIRSHMTSHILLAACAEDEQAYERDGQGLFTGELIRLLREYGTTSYTYEGLIQDIKIDLLGSRSKDVLRGPRCVVL